MSLSQSLPEASVIEPRHIPGLPESWDELLECLKEGEEEIERGEFFAGEEVFNSIRERIRSYAS